MLDIALIDNETTCEAVSAPLHRLVGPRKQFTYDCAAAAIQVERRSMESWVAGVTAPQLCKFLRLSHWLGPAFANDVMGLAGLHTLPVEPADGCDFALNEDIVALLFKLAWAFKNDGKVDHQERAEILPLAKIAHARLGAYLSQHDPNVRAPLRAAVVPE